MNRIILRTLITMVFAVPAMSATTLKPAPKSTPMTWEVGTYTYDGSGNIVAISGMSDTYLYDGVGRLVQATANTTDHANAQTFSYDAFGNLLEVDTSIKIGSFPTSYGATIMGVEPKTNRLTNSAPCNTAGTPTCVAADSRGYDASGNMLGSLNGDAYDFDALDSLIERRGVGGMRQRYLYDANGERVATLNLPPNGSTPTMTDFTLRGLTPQVLRTVRMSGTGAGATWSWREDYVYRNDKLLASMVADGTTSGKREHFHPDHLGTPRLITDDRGYKISLHTYWPFGQEAPNSDADGETMKFTGHERDFGFDSQRDLDYMHARYYSPLGGRFLSADSNAQVAFRLLTWNKYAYSLDNPVKYVDPDGHCALDDPNKCRAKSMSERIATVVKTFFGLDLLDKNPPPKPSNPPQAQGTMSGSAQVLGTGGTATGGTNIQPSPGGYTAGANANANVSVAGVPVTDASGSATYIVRQDQPVEVHSEGQFTGPTDDSKDDEEGTITLSTSMSYSFDFKVTIPTFRGDIRQGLKRALYIFNQTTDVLNDLRRGKLDPKPVPDPPQ